MRNLWGIRGISEGYHAPCRPALPPCFAKHPMQEAVQLDCLVLQSGSNTGEMAGGRDTQGGFFFLSSKKIGRAAQTATPHAGGTLQRHHYGAQLAQHQQDHASQPPPTYPHQSGAHWAKLYKYTAHNGLLFRQPLLWIDPHS